jgi:membrane-bound lytic murein transglycosylase B
MYGSWAGAMGHTQFIPTTYLAHSADYDGDRRSDIWQNIPDALYSTANYLRASGWVPGHTWGYEVRIPPGFDWRYVDETTRRSLGAVAANGDRAHRRSTVSAPG